jgi:hypothetical protein
MAGSHAPAASAPRLDYKERSNCFARLAIEVAAPSVAAALMAMAFDYASRAVMANPGPSGMLQRLDQFEGFGD